MSSVLLTNGRIHRTAQDTAPAEAMLLEAGKVAWLGRAAEAPAAQELLDLGGRVVLPALTDPHVHVFALALARLQVSFARSAVARIADIPDRLRAFYPDPAPGAWLHASDLIEDLLDERRLPTRADLDAAFPDNPVLLRRYCGHVAVMNGAALAALGLDDAVADPEGGSFGRLPSGALSGIAEESAAEWVFARAPVAPEAALAQAIREVIDEGLSYGLTALNEAAVGFSIGYDREAAVWERVRAAGPLPVRMGFMLQLDPDGAAARGLVPAFDANWSVETLKYFADGIVGGRSGAVSEPYEDTGGTGLLMQAPGVLEDQFARTHAVGWRIAVHATGDRAILRAVAAMEAAQGGETGRRHRIEHVFVPPEGIFGRMALAGILTVTQPSFLVRMGGSALRGLGAARARRAYPGASVLAAGAPLAFSSDAPTGFLSPWVGLAAAVTRRGSHDGQLGPEEALSRGAALSAYTEGGAYAMRHEGFRGVLRPGAAADLVVLPGDPFTLPPEDLAALRADLTFKEGQVVYRAPGAPEAI